ncbi:hypothetical protein [Agrobacterium albertimagni]|uniref:hypothetical protein n=1 Tax=Agrobacterium albertimagni TaxID=147266 RepID=UPI00058C43E5|nr:hypothetical protein [Agrobacterium albertimagni]
MASRFSQQIDRLIARLLIGKPQITLQEIRRLVPGVRDVEEHALAQKIDYLRQKNRKSPNLTGHHIRNNKGGPERETRG